MFCLKKNVNIDPLKEYNLFKGKEFGSFSKKMDVVRERKKTIRKEILTLLRNQKEDDWLRKSERIKTIFFQDPDVQNSKTVLFYASFQGEVDTFGLMRDAIKAGKQIALPVVDVQNKEIIPKLVTSLEDDLTYGPYHIQQPHEKNTREIALPEIDVVVVPGVAFDRRGFRLGRGAGYYDRFLKNLPQGIPLIGLAFDFQILDSLPLEPHDLSVTRVVTNSGWNLSAAKLF